MKPESPTHIRLTSGRRFDYLDMQPDDFTLRDLLEGMAVTTRWRGQSASNTRITVLEHCLIGSQRPEIKGFQREFFLHDAAEGFFCDIPRSLKQFLGSYRTLEDAFMEVISKKYDLACPFPGLVKTHDRRVLLSEEQALWPGAPSECGLPDLEPLPDYEVQGWDADVVLPRAIVRAHELGLDLYR